jgi:putative tricarboxylic transport membrane protein
MIVSFRRLEIAVSIALLLLGACWTFEAARMPFGTAAVPGPAMMPLALGILLMLTSATLIVLELRSPVEVETVPFGNRHIATAVAAVLVAGLVFERAGFLITSTLFLFALLVTLSTLGWWRSLLASVAASIAALWFFDRLLGVVLPPLPFTT